MWNATTRGFFSAVQHRDDKSLLVVRTRVKADAQTLADWYAQYLTAIREVAGQDEVDALPAPVITSYQFSDYPWRVIMPRTVWGAFLAETVEDLDYGNFKDAVKATQGADRAHVYGKVWSALLALEDNDPESTRAGRWADYNWEPADRDLLEEPWEWKDPEAGADEPDPWGDLDAWIDREPTSLEVTQFLGDVPAQERDHA